MMILAAKLADFASNGQEIGNRENPSSNIQKTYKVLFAECTIVLIQIQSEIDMICLQYAYARVNSQSYVSPALSRIT